MKPIQPTFAVLAFFVLGASLASANDFPTVVTEILNSQTDGPISQMAGEQKQSMIDCVNGVLTDLPKGRKDHILEGTSLEERERRFGIVLHENRAEWMQKVSQGCSSIATN